jgi:magnesium transporter
MAKSRKRLKKPGSSPGTLVYTGHKSQESVTLDLFRYDEQAIDYIKTTNTADLLQSLDPAKVNWINVNGLHDNSIIEGLGKHFEIHPLVLEDILHTEHLPKTEDFDNYIFLTLKMLSWDDNKNTIALEHVSLVLGDNYLISFQEKEGDLFSIIRDSLNFNKGRLRKRNADYLFYRLIDVIVDNYYIITDKIEDELEELEDFMLTNQDTDLSRKILEKKKKMIFLRKSVLPLRDEFRKFKSREFNLIADETYSFLNDVNDHLQHLTQIIEAFRDLITSLMELQLSLQSKRLNDVMKTLTTFASVFMPLTFIAGIYGMNFHYMPELEWKWGYPIILGVMAAATAVLLWYMHRKKWL